MASIGIVGAGVGALAAAIRLRSRGHDVEMFERRDRVGGKLAGLERDEFHFDIGPSLLTWPSVFEDLFAAAGTSLSQYVRLQRLAEPFRYEFADGTRFRTADTLDQTATAIGDAMGSRAQGQWTDFMQRAARAWQVSERTFFAGAMHSPLDLLRRFQAPGDLVAVDPFISLASRSRRAFDDERLQQWLNRYATYSGSDPWHSPATSACIPWLEQHHGAWHVQGGLAGLATALSTLAHELGIRIHCGVDVKALIHDQQRISAIRTVDGDHRFDIVVAGCDAEHLYNDLLPNRTQQRRLRQTRRSTSGFALLLDVRGETEDLAHHNVWFSSDQRREFSQIRTGVADDPTVYACVSVRTDDTQAPPGDENWFVLVNTAAGATADWDAYGDRIIRKLGLDDRISGRSHMTPADYGQHYRAPGGAIYGTSSNGRRAAFLRPTNRGPLENLYLVGGSSHPGGGLPLVATSGRIVADLIAKEHPQ